LAGIYIHIPFCRKACTYCNFHFSTSLQQKKNFLDALHHEIKLRRDFLKEGQSIETIYFGGGTPSLLESDEIKAIMDALQENYLISSDTECTLEANPDDITTSGVKAWMQAGINRLSLGVQSFDDAELGWMNRAHTASQSLQSIDEIQEAGMQNFSVDLIFGSPLQSQDSLEKNTQLITSKKIKHISCYALTVEPRTVLFQQVKKGQTADTNPEQQANDFLFLMNYLQDAGYEHYEISNYALPGYRSKHNSSYWQGLPYLGLGPSAHGYDGMNKRRWNIANNSIYIHELLNNRLPFEEETLEPVQQLNEYIMTALRTAEGISLERVSNKFGDIKEEALKNKVSGLNPENISITDGKIILSNAGKLFADGLASSLFF
jgi:oxygen-independent coproporphyrinogen III oxidase